MYSKKGHITDIVEKILLTNRSLFFRAGVTSIIDISAIASSRSYSVGLYTPSSQRSSFENKDDHIPRPEQHQCIFQSHHALFPALTVPSQLLGHHYTGRMVYIRVYGRHRRTKERCWLPGYRTQLSKLSSILCNPYLKTLRADPSL